MKDLQNIKDEWAKYHGYIDYKEFYELTRAVDTYQVFIMDGAVNQVAIRYANEQKRELVEMLIMINEGIHTMDFTQLEHIQPEIEQLIKEATEG